MPTLAMPLLLCTLLGAASAMRDSDSQLSLELELDEANSTRGHGQCDVDMGTAVYMHVLKFGWQVPERASYTAIVFHANAGKRRAEAHAEEADESGQVFWDWMLVGAAYNKKEQYADECQVAPGLPVATVRASFDNGLLGERDSVTFTISAGGGAAPNENGDRITYKVQKTPIWTRALHAVTGEFGTKVTETRVTFPKLADRALKPTMETNEYFVQQDHTGDAWKIHSGEQVVLESHVDYSGEVIHVLQPLGGKYQQTAKITKPRSLDQWFRVSLRPHASVGLVISLVHSMGLRDDVHHAAAK
jgi:hypothetical protein